MGENKLGKKVKGNVIELCCCGTFRFYYPCPTFGGDLRHNSNQKITEAIMDYRDTLVLLPALNEEEAIGQTIDDVRLHLPGCRGMSARVCGAFAEMH